VPSPEAELELAARRLQGETLVRVHYLDPWPGIERDDAAADADTVGLAVYLGLASGRSVEVRWADELGIHHGFGVAVRDVGVPDGDLGRLTDATARWADRIGARITGATVTWGDTRAELRGPLAIGVGIGADYLRRVDYPRALLIDFAGAPRVAIEAPFASALSVFLRSP
jgi:hypothetical protein